jgi:hypothetical protein
MMDKERLEELKKLCEDATPGPWWQYRHGVDDYQNGGLCANDTELWGGYDGCMPSSADIELMAQSRTALPELIAEVEFLTKVAEQAKEFSTLVLGTANDEPTIKNDEEGCWDYIGDSYAELAQYLKRGKE